MQTLIKKLLIAVGEDPKREGLLNTPARVEHSLQFLTQGYSQNLKTIVNGALFESQSDEIIILKGIEFYSVCEHHLIPFFGRCHIGYLPSKKIIGLSKLARIADMFSRRLQVQEKLTQQIAQAIEEVLQPRGVGVVMEAQHLCMLMRGVQKQDSKMVTSSMLGLFRTDARTRSEFLQLIEH